MFGKKIKKAISCRRTLEGARLCRSSNYGLNIEIASNSEAVIYGVKNIVDYTPEMIRLGHKSGAVSFCGCGLSCQSFVEGAVCIRGYITSVQFEMK